MEWTVEDSIIAANAMKGLGPARINKLIKSGDIVRFISGHSDVNNLYSNMQLQRQTAREVNAQFVPASSKYYPAALYHLEHPPPLLHAIGDLNLLNQQHGAVAIIGARACTQYGREQAVMFGKAMAYAQETTVSGAARGIDMFSMQAAVNAGGKVIAVLGSGLDVCYPREAFKMLAQIIEHGGLIISEFPFGTRPLAGHFPRRNRIIAALSRAIFVIQATLKSGTLNTTDWALKLGKDIYALPGPIDDYACTGTNWLISQGATPVLSREDFLCSLQRMTTVPDCPNQLAVLNLLSEQNWLPFEISEQLSIDVNQVNMLLLELELQGRICRTNTGNYRLTGPK